MIPTPEQIAHVLELDSKRTQGEWRTEQGQSMSAGCDIDFWYSIITPNEDGSFTYVVDGDGTNYNDYPNAPQDFAFIAAAPLMVQIIRHQQEQLRVAREALYELQLEKDGSDCDVAIKALSLINNSTTTKEQP